MNDHRVLSSNSRWQYSAWGLALLLLVMQTLPHTVAAHGAREHTHAHVSSNVPDQLKAIDTEDEMNLNPRFVYEGEVVKLTDKTFEHATQASTGQTTGVWFVRLQAPGCRICQKQSRKWRQVAGRLEEKVVVAEVEVPHNAKVLKRFTKRGLATSLPSMLLFRDRKVYPYLGARDSVDQMAAFALEGYKTADGVSPVPPEITWLDEFLEGMLDRAWLFVPIASVLIVGLAIGAHTVRGGRKHADLKLP
mmetsp:Transcript_5576/g.9623  ORF Transcript_5576/g.9623 Transcript_5576/m.9623 type:complete len:248 (-) Transcript_5576:168-911(-)|eukprot:CAMPEP_0198215730 /NCGR_PEP_ID=MMETSP1445-20131203/52306_1 /TAXON_ID=36898 /ORGANISM="Pyramimonas sp., Strain CCMP2087" /LENGTH=247 /DNA_ID=CAMNT_0043891597 /DNA_START=113 /DNA_END=856 /DNA_ORIENTATION=-